jgi:hypothetical protein
MSGGRAPTTVTNTRHARTPSEAIAATATKASKGQGNTVVTSTNVPSIAVAAILGTLGHTR